MIGASKNIVLRVGTFGRTNGSARRLNVFVHFSAVERAGLSTLNEGQRVQYEIVSNRGKESAENLKVS
jgi:CspA family cold shock protein